MIYTNIALVNHKKNQFEMLISEKFYTQSFNGYLVWSLN